MAKKNDPKLDQRPKNDTKAWRKKKREKLVPKTKIGMPPKTYSDEECIELGEDLLEWLQDPKGGLNCCQFVRWYGIKHNMFTGDWKDLTHRAYFAPYYEKARKLIAENIMRNKDINQSYGNRYIHIYDQDLDDFEEQKADKQSERRIREKRKEIQETALAHNEFIESIKDGTFLESIKQKDKDE